MVHGWQSLEECRQRKVTLPESEIWPNLTHVYYKIVRLWIWAGYSTAPRITVEQILWDPFHKHSHKFFSSNTFSGGPLFLLQLLKKKKKKTKQRTEASVTNIGANRTHMSQLWSGLSIDTLMSHRHTCIDSRIVTTQLTNSKPNLQG